MSAKLLSALWKIYNRPATPLPFSYGGNLPWDDPAFGTRMLHYHLAEDDNAASRVSAERTKQIDWLWQQFDLKMGQHLFDVTCGPGLYALAFAQRGLTITGVDFSSVSIEYAKELVKQHSAEAHCHFDIADIRQMDYTGRNFDAAILLYGQLAVMTMEEAQIVLNAIYASLKKGAPLCLELLNPARVDRKNSTWWYTNDSGLWGDDPYLHLGERFWDAETQISTERYQILHLDSGELDEILLCDQVYSAETITHMLKTAGFTTITPHPAWDNIGLYDGEEWIVYVAR